MEYSHSVSEVKALAGKTKTAFLLRAADLNSIVAVSRAGFRLPQKSTYFYPKLLSGLLIRSICNSTSFFRIRRLLSTLAITNWLLSLSIG